MTKSARDVLTDLKSDNLPPFCDIEGEIQIDSRGWDGMIPLHVFASRGDVESCRILLEAGSEVNAIGEDRFTPLHEAAIQGHDRVVDLLLSFGADPDLDTDTGATEFLAEDYPEVLDVLREHHKTEPDSAPDGGDAPV